MSRERTIILDDLRSLRIDQRQSVIYDRPIGMQLLHEDPASGEEHYLVEYPAGLQARRHRHTASSTIVVIEGRLEVDGTVIGPGAYCHFPAGQPMHHAPAPGESCLFIKMFHGPSDVQPMDG